MIETPVSATLVGRGRATPELPTRARASGFNYDNGDEDSDEDDYDEDDYDEDDSDEDDSL